MAIKEDKTFIPEGAYIMARKGFDGDLWLNKPSGWWKIWEYIIGHVNHEKTSQYKRGEGFFNFTKIVNSSLLGQDVTLNQIREFFRYAKTARQITTQKTTRGVIVFVCNYGIYQKLNSYKNKTETNTPHKSHPTQKQHYKQEDKNKEGQLSEKPEKQPSSDQSSLSKFHSIVGSPCLRGSWDNKKRLRELENGDVKIPKETWEEAVKDKHKEYLKKRISNPRTVVYFRVGDLIKQRNVQQAEAQRQTKEDEGIYGPLIDKKESGT